MKCSISDPKIRLNSVTLIWCTAYPRVRPVQVFLGVGHRRYWWVTHRPSSIKGSSITQANTAGNSRRYTQQKETFAYEQGEGRPDGPLHLKKERDQELERRNVERGPQGRPPQMRKLMRTPKDNIVTWPPARKEFDTYLRPALTHTRSWFTLIFA